MYLGTAWNHSSPIKVCLFTLAITIHHIIRCGMTISYSNFGPWTHPAQAHGPRPESTWPMASMNKVDWRTQRVVTCCNGRGIRRIFDADGIRWNLGNLFKQPGKDAHEESQRSPISPAFVLWISYEIQCFTTDISTDSTKANAEQTL